MSNKGKMSNKAGKWCEIHQSETHNTAECNVVRNAKKRHDKERGGDEAHATKRAKHRNGDNKGNQGKRTFTRNEVNAITEEVVRAMTERFENDSDGKRKPDSDTSSASEDSNQSASDQDNDLMVVQEVLVTKQTLQDLNINGELDDDNVSNTSEKLREEVLGLDE